MAKKTKTKSVKKSAAKGPELPSLVEAMTKLVERLTSVESKMDVLLGRVSNLAFEVRNLAPASQRPSSVSAPAAEGRRERVLYQAVCADCHKSCEVPFKPGERPVYCKECWVLRKSGHVPQNPDRRIPVSEQKKNASYVPSALGENAIPTLAGNVSVFTKTRSKPAKAKPAKSKKKR